MNEGIDSCVSRPCERNDPSAFITVHTPLTTCVHKPGLTEICFRELGRPVSKRNHRAFSAIIGSHAERPVDVRQALSVGSCPDSGKAEAKVLPCTLLS